MEAKTLKISLPKGVWEVINKDLGWLGNTESEIIQNIVISSIFLNSYDTNSDKHACDEYNNDLHVLEYMIDSIVELLEDKKIISSKEWRERVQQVIFTSLSI
ncbi:MAG: hypothetical protein WCB31_08790 [Nitrososphaeraceae archaeon]